jgi:CRISPR-associated protein Cmr2
MTDSNNTLWQTKVAARLHDPAEKALVLMRDPAGHEGGTSRALTRLLAMHESDEVIMDDDEHALAKAQFKHGIPASMYRIIQRADWWAAAADRPQWPMQEITVTTKKGEQKILKIANWAQVRWANSPVLIHPLTGEQFALPGGLNETDFKDIRKRSFDHVAKLLATLHKHKGEEQDWRSILLTLWRFGPEVKEDKDNGKLGELWHLLPADTRVPDHSIWDHLDIVSAFAGAFAADPAGHAALLTLSIGPVQPFIASARKMDDLWAGSHLLARLSWEGMRVVCEQLGPDAILFPRLRGVPQVDLWLRDNCRLPQTLFDDCEWNKGGTDSNPLFSAALPNRFVAVVPRSQAEALAEKVQHKVRAWLRELGDAVVTRLLQEAGYSEMQSLRIPYQQMKDQLEGFPEVNWAAVPFSLILEKDRKQECSLDVSKLAAAMRPFFQSSPENGDEDNASLPGFLATPAWRLLQQRLDLIDEQGKKTVFFNPNPGVLYPAVHDLAERLLASAKSLRAFAQTSQEGWRCSLTGETEWITTDRKQLQISYRQQSDTLWAKIAANKPAWAKEGEHLGGLAAIKRLWPTLFKEEVDQAIGNGEIEKGIDRFVVSTHTMALAYQLDQWLSKDPAPVQLTDFGNIESVALPRKLMIKHGNKRAIATAKKLPGLLDAMRDREEEEKARAQAMVKKLLGSDVETYYSLIMMDGDRMGAWLGGGEKYAISYRDSFHPQVQQGFDQHAQGQSLIQQYGRQKRALSPNRHLAISGALNDFSLTVVRYVIENEYLGRLIYSGGDDVFAMLPVADLLPAIRRLRCAYSGHDPEQPGGVLSRGLTLHHGFAMLNGRLMRMMGTEATASCGAVIAHHQAPLSFVRRELAAAEKRAKSEGGRDAFSITIIKRSGGALHLTEKWGPALDLLASLRDFLSEEDVSRRAAYHTLAWLNEHELPSTAFADGMVKSLLAYQLDRQAKESARSRAPKLAEELYNLARTWAESERIHKLRNFLAVAEFLAREIRVTPNVPQESSMRGMGGAA